MGEITTFLNMAILTVAPSRSGKYFFTILNKLKQTEHSFVMTLAFLTGLIAGFAAIGIRWLIHTISGWAFPGGGDVLTNIMNSPWYVILFLPAIGGALVGPIIYFFSPESKGHGVPEVMQAVIIGGAKIRPRVAIIKAITAAITIGTGGSVGREGPIVQIGASLASTVGQMFQITHKQLKTLVGAGAAAGIAAAFNAPIAGALFAVEVILMDFQVSQFSPIVIASVIATFVSHHYQGNFSEFQVPHYNYVSSLETFTYLGLGIFTGIISFVSIKILYAVEDFSEERLTFIPSYILPAVGGIAIGGIGLVFPQVMGMGYASIDSALNGNMLWVMALILVFAKIFATSITLGSGGSGGVFAPALFIGATSGAFFGSFIHWAFPAWTGTPGAYALVAMGGLVAGTMRAPITAIIIVMELTGNYEIILPLMITCIISTIVATKLSRESIYTLKLIKRKIKLHAGFEYDLMKDIYVSDIYQRRIDTILVSAGYNEVIKKLISIRSPYLNVVNKKNILYGTISIHDIKDYIFEKDLLKNILIAGDIADTNCPVISLEDNAKTVLSIMRTCNNDQLPVTNSKKELIGTILRKDILNEYHAVIERMDVGSSFATRLMNSNSMPEEHFLEGYSICELKTPGDFVGRSIRELEIRNRFKVDVLSIRDTKRMKNNISLIPDPNYVLTDNDNLIIAGAKNHVDLFKTII